MARPSLAPLHDERACGGRAAADVERRESARVRHLVVAGGALDLARGVEDHAHARRADRMALSDEPAGRVHREAAGRGDRAVLDRAVALARWRQPEVIE